MLVKKTAIHVLQWGVTIGLLAWLFRDVDTWTGMLRRISSANMWWILAALVLAGVDQVFNIWRWGIYLRVQKINAPWKLIIKVFMAGLFFNMLLPGMVSGDLVKIALFGAVARGQLRAVTLSVVADRLIGLVALVPFRYDFFQRTPSTRALLWSLVIGGAAATVLLLGSFVLTRARVREKLPERFPLRQKLLEIGEAWQLFAVEWRASLKAFALSFPVLFTYFGVYWCCGKAFAAPSTFWDVSCVMPVVAVLSSVPISFSGLGVREVLFTQLLGDLARVPEETAILLSLAGFLVYSVWNVLGVFFCAAELPGLLARKKNADRC